VPPAKADEQRHAFRPGCDTPVLPFRRDLVNAFCLTREIRGLNRFSLGTPVTREMRYRTR
jgi:hypothetical protein